MGFATGLQAGSNLVSSDIVQKIGLKKERKRAGKLLEEFNAKLEEYQLSDNELSYSEKVQLAVLANQIGSDYAKSLDELNASQSSFDKEKMSQEYQTLRNKNDLLATLIKEIKDNKYLSQADLSALDEITGIQFSKLWNKETIDGIRNEETKQQTLDNVFGVAKELPTEYTMPYMAGQGVPGLEGLQPTTAPKAPGISDYKGAVDYLSKFINTDPTTFNKIKAGFQNQFPNIDMSSITQESIREPEKITKTKAVDSNDILFGTNGIMKAYINSGSQLGDEQKAEILNNYNLIKPSLSADVRTQVEDYLKQIGIDVNAPVEAPIPEPTPETPQPGPLQKGVNAVKNWLGMKGTPQQQGQQDYTAMGDDELADLALTGDQAAINELKRRGLL